MSKFYFVAGLVALLAALLPVASAHLLDGNRGPVDAYNYDEVKAAHLNEDCAKAFECQPADAKDAYFYNCAYDVASAECQCSQGGFSRCRVASSSLDPAVARMRSGGVSSIAGLVTRPVKSAFAALGGMPVAAKLALLAVFVAAAFIVFSRTRDSASNNLRKARSLHERATALHEKGREEEARLLFEKSSYHREKAAGGMK